MATPKESTAADVLARLRSEERQRDAERPPRVDVRPSRYTVTCVPADSAPDAHVWALYVEQKRDGMWVVTNGFDYLRSDLTFEFRPSSTCLFDLDTALALAKEAAPLVTVNGRTVADALRIAAEWKKQQDA